MKKLEDLPKTNIFDAPEGYFDQLPGIIQSRIVKNKANRTQLSLGFALKYALPVLLLAGIGLFWFNANTLESTDVELETVSPDQLSLFLSDTDISADELIETVAWSSDDVDDLEDEIYSTMKVTTQEIENALDYGSEL